MKSKISILPAKPGEAAVLSSIALVSKAYWGYPKEWLKLWEDELTITARYIEENTVYKSTDKSKIIGWAAVEKTDEYFEIGHLWLKPEFIGKGVGKLLLEEAIARTVPAGALIRVISDPYAEPFYRKLGFEKKGEFPSRPEGRFLPVLEKVN